VTVSLVGAGPGDPELITVRGLARVRACEVLVYDRLVAQEIVAEAPIAPSGATITCSSSVVPRETTAAGVEAGFPSAIRRSASRPTTAPPMKATSVPGTAARPRTSSASTSFAANAVTACETPRCVTGMPTDSGTAAIDETPGTSSNGTPARTSASASSPPRPKTNGSPPFSRTVISPRRPYSTRQASISSWVIACRLARLPT